MNGLLKFISTLNAAIWCGASVFLLVGLPALFSPGLEQLLTKPYAGFAAEAVFGRYFMLYYACGAVALLCHAAHWIYSGKSSRFDATLATLLTGVGLLSGLLLQPHMHDWHYLKYWGKTPEIREHAAHLFGIWHGISQSFNLLIIAALVLYLWRISRSGEQLRFVAFGKK